MNMTEQNFHREEPLEPPQAIDVRWDDNPEVAGVELKLDQSSYAASVSQGIMYTGLLRVPEDQRRQGIGTKLLLKLVETAKEKGINKIWHTIQSVEGLQIISKVLNMPDRTYYTYKDEEVTFQEALNILQQKRAEGEDDNTDISIGSMTEIDRLDS